MPTDPSRWAVMADATADVMRRMTPAQRLGIANDLFHMARGVLGAQIENERPDWEADQINREVSRRISLGVEPFGCDLAAWLRLHAQEFGEGPWAADQPLFVATDPASSL
jgi:hypothetical protein